MRPLALPRPLSNSAPWKTGPKAAETTPPAPPVRPWGLGYEGFIQVAVARRRAWTPWYRANPRPASLDRSNESSTYPLVNPLQSTPASPASSAGKSDEGQRTSRRGVRIPGPVPIPIPKCHHLPEARFAGWFGRRESFVFCFSFFSSGPPLAKRRVRQEKDGRGSWQEQLQRRHALHLHPFPHPSRSHPTAKPHTTPPRLCVHHWNTRRLRGEHWGYYGASAVTLAASTSF